MATERPRYEVLQQRGDLEVREYAPYLVAETEVGGDLEAAGTTAFRVLAGYIFGKNRGSQQLAMTAPVTQRKSETVAMTAPVAQVATSSGTWAVQFMMPSNYTLATLPEPLDPAVQLREMPARKMAALRYSGTWSARNYEKHLAQLRSAVDALGLHARGEAVWARYDPPWKPWFLRTNEILLELAD